MPGNVSVYKRVALVSDGADGGGSATFAAADANHDDRVTSSGALMILRGWLGDHTNIQENY
ncbi:hypothetical protein DRO03_09385 [Methanosarcinales archaeon]|nr:MAG: hypothetical protein DRO03_09385 [Methanosarcinales archaeon]